MKRPIALLLAGAMSLGLLTACKDHDPTTPTTKPTNSTKPIVSANLKAIHTAESEDELYKLMTARNYGDDMFLEEEGVATEGAVDGVVSMPTKDFATNSYGTNVQVANFDEGDCVKTDGKNLYILSSYDFKIVSAAGAASKELSTTNVTFEGERYGSNAALYVYGDRVIVISSYGFRDESDDFYRYVDLSTVNTYDISDPTAPVLLKTMQQEGDYLDSRMVDGKLYLVTSQYKHSVYEGYRKTFLPCLWDEGYAEPMALDHIYVCPGDSADGYTTVGLYDIQTAERSDINAFTGLANSIYMDESGLYIANNVYVNTESEPYTEAQYTVVDKLSTVQTDIKKLTTDGTTLTLAANAMVDGKVLNQYSMDVYNGNLRIATSSNRNSFSVYTDETYGFHNYKTGEDYDGNNLFILDEQLQELGSVTDYAKDERIYSCRFMGNLGFVVTYRETDPLFAFDLTDPKNPKILSELKVTGVSDYLHMFADGKLFGLGTSDDWTLQAQMFDVSDLNNLKLETRLTMDENYYSEALHNARAILLAPERGLIAFPTDSGYAVLHYDGSDLTLKGEFECFSYSNNNRGMLIGDTIYICEPSAVMAVDAESLQTIASLEFGVG